MNNMLVENAKVMAKGQIALPKDMRGDNFDYTGGGDISGNGNGIFRLAGHEILPLAEIDDDKLYSIEEIFPDLSPAKILRGFRSFVA
jgi:hypothetical protein